MKAARAFLLLLLLLPLCFSCAGEGPAFHRPAVIVLGFDGMDPVILAAEMAAGNLPNFARLAREGDFTALQTSLPPESPVAWANFITGMDPGGHGMFDFLHRRITSRGVVPVAAGSESTAPKRFVPFFGYRVPLDSGEMRNTVRGTFFWEHLARRGIPVSVLRIPDNYPPRETGGRTFSGMGTPDLLGTLGVFHYYTELAPENLEDLDNKAVLRIIEVKDGIVRTELDGPENTFLPPDPRRGLSPIATAPLTIYLDRERESARIDLGGETTVLAEGQWSDWVTVDFELLPFVASVRGIVRFYLKEASPHLKLYVSPVNIDPRDPASPVSSPPEASEELAAAIGPYFTQGMAEETNAARTEVFDTAEFLGQADLVLEESRRMLRHELGRFRREGGFTFFYFSTTDLCSHILYQHRDEGHPRHDAETSKPFARQIEKIYAEMDEVVGEVMEAVPEGTRIVVMSDHGFSTLRRKLSVNAWLEQNGFLTIRSPLRRDEKYFGNVAWLDTKAYNLGFCGIYLNLMGREEMGIVAPGAEAEQIEDQIIAGLTALVDPETGERVVTNVYRRKDVYHGAEAENGPDLILGFAAGYENQDGSAQGAVSTDLLVDNRDAWSGSHLMDPSHVPGILLANTKFHLKDPRLIDLTVTILGEFGIRVEELTGRPIWEPE